MNISRAELIRQAIMHYISQLNDQAKLEEEKKRKEKLAAMQSVYGLWEGRNIDSVEYVRNLRSEWDREWDSVKGEWIYKNES